MPRLRVHTDGPRRHRRGGLLLCILATVSAVIPARGDPPASVASVAIPVGEASGVGPAVPGGSVSDPTATMTPLPVGARFQRHVVVVGGGEVASAGAPGELVYDNTLGKVAIGTVREGYLVADDITTTAAAGCLLNRYLIRVTGDLSGEGQHVDVPFSVTIALYRSCPGASPFPTLIPGTQVTIDLPDGGLHEVEVVIPPDVEIPLRSSFYLGVSFNRTNAGIVVGAPALKGVSVDRFDYPGFPCGGTFGGYPVSPHASFYAQIYVRPGCAASFPGYRATRQSGPAFTEGPRDVTSPGWNTFGDDMRLAVHDCKMVAYEVSVKGKAATSSGAIEVDLKSHLDDASPETGGRIPGARQVIFVFGTSVVVAHFDFDPPIPLPPDVFMTFATSNDVVGPIVAGRAATVGSTGEYYWRYDSNQRAWETAAFANGSFGAFDITIYCEGAPPAGACCDSLQTDDLGDAVCRDVPEMNCPENRWLEAEACEGDPFIPACGLGACCTPNDTCENLTRNECLALAPPGDNILWKRSVFCGDVGAGCPYYACVQRSQGDCAAVHDDPGCPDPFCCSEVCRFDPFCCEVTWDEVCVRWQQEEVNCRIAGNSKCAGTSGRGALPVEVGGGAIVGNGHAGQDASDPSFCCSDRPNQLGMGSLWFTFVATETSARISTCDSNPSDLDSLIQVLRPLDPTTPETACASLDTLACNDDVAGCGDGRLSEICVDGLVPGETYYLLLAGKTEEDRGIYHLDIDAPCTPDETIRPPNDACVGATPIASGTTPFDFVDATFDCPRPACVGPAGAMGKDIWYRWEPSISGAAVIETCESSAAAEKASLAVYEGCDCPVDPGTELACSGGPSRSCESGVRVSLTVRDDTCYLIRVGAAADAEPTGELVVRRACPDGAPVFHDPPPLVVDARQPHPPGDAALRQGLDRFTASAPIGADMMDCWSICEPADADPPNAIAGVTDNGNGTLTLTLQRPIAPGAVTMIEYRIDGGGIWSSPFVAHPGNVNGDDVTDAGDLTALLGALGGATPPAWGIYSVDIDHSGSLSPGDVLRLIDLLNGGDAYAPGWRGTARPMRVDECAN